MESILEKREEVIGKMAADMGALSSDEIAAKVVGLLIQAEGNLNRYQQTLELVLDAHRRSILLHNMSDHRVQHRKGGTYGVIAPVARVQTDTPLSDYAAVSVYLSETDGTWWVRPITEMEDGRFSAAPGAVPRELQHESHFGEWPGIPIFENTVNGWKCQVTAIEHHGVKFVYEGRKQPHYLGREEFRRRFLLHSISRADAAPETQTVGVKQLEWEESVEENGRYASAKTLIGGYDVFDFTMTVAGKSRTVIGWSGHWINAEQRTATFEDAKAAAQADYERRIMSALTTEGQP